METPADPTQDQTNPAEAALGEEIAVGSVEDAQTPSGPSGLRLAVTSVGAFLAIVAIGGAIGLLSGAGVDDADALTAAMVIDPVDVDAGVEVDVAGAVETTTVAPTTVAPLLADDLADTVEVTAEDVTVNEPVVVVRGVTELALPLADESADADLRARPGPTEIEFLELPKAVYDRFTLRTGDSFAINIAANDKIGGVLQSVTLTGLGELAPGFALDADGTVAGIASECGVWKAQYALNSTNPAVGTSWIDITVSGCSGT